jgi:hypothetical protein
MIEAVRNRLFGSTATQEREAAFVDVLVDQTESSASIAAMVNFGQALIKANGDRIAAIDGKATNILGYSIAILAFISTQPLIGQSPLRTFPLMLAAVFALLGGWSAALTTHAARNWQSMSECTWFPDSAATASDSDQLNRWYLKAMHESLQVNQRKANQKAAKLTQAQVATAAAGLCLGLSLAGSALLALQHALF